MRLLRADFPPAPCAGIAMKSCARVCVDVWWILVGPELRMSMASELRIVWIVSFIMWFEGVCLDSHHPDHRRAWKGGSEPHFLTPLPADPRDPRMESFLRLLGMKNNENGNPISETSKNIVFECFCD